MKTWLFTYLAVVVTYLVMDGIWLGIVAKDTYATAMQGMMRESYPVWPWVTFYLVYCVAIVVLVIEPNKAASLAKVLVSGALLGAAAYGAYNLTNYAILEGWPLSISLKDWAWGTFVTTCTSLAGWKMHSYLINN